MNDTDRAQYQILVKTPDRTKLAEGEPPYKDEGKAQDRADFLNARARRLGWALIYTVRRV